MARILSVAGARPNFVKIAALHHAFVATPGLTSHIVHTGQHYDRHMSDVFFEQLGVPEPDHHLGVGSGSHAEQTAGVLLGMERVLAQSPPDVLLVVGDVNSTLAATLAGVKSGIPVAHVEAGLRSGDRTMPEELNRLATDAVADLLYASEASGVEHLKREGHPEERIIYVGNVMIDSLERSREAASATKAAQSLGLPEKGYVLVTMHRPATVDVPDQLATLVEALTQATEFGPVVWPLHPRSRQGLERSGLLSSLASTPGVRLLDPVGYLEFLDLQAHAGAVITDSGGVQEETTVLGIPCLTLRSSTERPATVTHGSNRLLPLETETITAALRDAFAGQWSLGTRPPLWDGHAAKRVATDLLDRFG